MKIMYHGTAGQEMNMKAIFAVTQYEPTLWPAPSWLVSSVGRALHRYRRGHGFKSHTGLLLKCCSLYIHQTTRTFLLRARVAARQL